MHANEPAHRQILTNLVALLKINLTLKNFEAACTLSREIYIANLTVLGEDHIETHAARGRLAKLLRKCNLPDEAAELEARHRTQLGWENLLYRKQYKEAVCAIQAFLSSDVAPPDESPHSHYAKLYLAVALDKSGRRDEAKLQLEQLLKDQVECNVDESYIAKTKMYLSQLRKHATRSDDQDGDGAKSSKSPTETRRSDESNKIDDSSRNKNKNKNKKNKIIDTVNNSNDNNFKKKNKSNMNDTVNNNNDNNFTKKNKRNNDIVDNNHNNGNSKNENNVHHSLSRREISKLMDKKRYRDVIAHLLAKEKRLDTGGLDAVDQRTLAFAYRNTKQIEKAREAFEATIALQIEAGDEDSRIAQTRKHLEKLRNNGE